MIYYDVDTDLAAVPVNVAALIDDDDFKSIEASIAFGVVTLQWNFTKTDGTTTQTAVTVAASGNYEWINEGNGMYAVDIPASGGASIDNDEEGFGYFSGSATGCLPFRGPTVCCRAAGLNNLQIDNAYSATRGLAGTALPDAAANAATGLPISTAGALDMDAILVDTNSLNDTKVPQTLNLTASGNIGVDWANVENPTTALNLSQTDIQTAASVTDGATQAAVDNIGAASGGSVNIEATYDNTTTDTIANLAADDKGDGTVGIPVIGHSFVAGREITITGSAQAVYNDSFDIVSQTADEIIITVTYAAITFAGTEDIVSSIKGVVFVGSVQSGSYSSTEGENGVYHDIDYFGDDDIDIVYGYAVGGNRQATSVDFAGFVQGSSDEMIIAVYDHVGDAWENKKTISGTNGSDNTALDIALLSKHTGTGSDLGKVFIRIHKVTTTPSNLSVDMLLTSAVNVSQSVGYADGAIWVDTNHSSTGTTPYVDGVADNPAGTWAAALTLSASLGIERFRIVNGSAIELTGTSDNFTMLGFGWTLDLSDEAINGAYIEGAIVSGTGTATSVNPKFKECRFGTVTLPPCGCQTCGFGVGGLEFTAGSTGQYAFIDSFSLVPGSGSPTLNFDGVGDTVGINVRRWAGGATYVLDDDCTLSHEVLTGGGTTITTGGADVEIRGITRSVTITASAAETIQFVGTTGPVTLNGTTTATFNLYGVAGNIVNNTSAGTLNDYTVSRENIPDDVWDETLTGSSHNVANSAGRRLRQLTVQVLLDGTSPGGNTSTTLVLDGDASSTSRIYDPSVLWIYEGKGAGQSRQVFEYNGVTKTCYINRDWVTGQIPDATSKYILTANSGGTHVNEGKAQGAGGGTNTLQLNTLAETTDDVYVGQTIFIVAGAGADQSGSVTGYVGLTQIATVEHDWAITPDATSIYAMLPNITHSIAETQSGLATAAVLAEVPSETNSKTLNATALAAIMAEVWSQQMTELSAIPGVSGTMIEALTTLFMALVNEQVSNTGAGLQSIAKRDNTVIGTANMTDSGGVFTKEKYT